MESNLNEENVTVQSLINSVSAASGGEQTGHPPSLSSDCTTTISEVGNLASVIEKVSRSNENKKTDQESDNCKITNNVNENVDAIVDSGSLQYISNKICSQSDSDSPSNNLTSAIEKSSTCMKVEEQASNNEVNKKYKKSEIYDPFDTELQSNENEEKSITNNSTQINDNPPILTLTDQEMITINPTKITHTNILPSTKKRMSGAQRRKLKKLAIHQEKSQKDCQPVIYSTTSSEKNPILRTSEKKNNIQTIKQETNISSENNTILKTSEKKINIQAIRKDPNKSIINNNDNLKVTSTRESVTNVQRHDPTVESRHTEKNQIRPESNTIIENKIDVKRQELLEKRLSGAGKRRMGFLLSKGYNREEAKLLAQDKVRFRELKRQIIPKKVRDPINVSTFHSGNLSVAESNCRRPIYTRYTSKEVSKTAFPKVVVGFFPDSNNDTTARILTFIHWQNEGLYVFGWKLLRKSSKNSNIMLTLLVDKRSAAKLEELKGEIFYKFRKIRLHIKDYDGKKETVAISGTDRSSNERRTEQIPNKIPRLQ